MRVRIDGKLAMVTGASSGIGRALARLLAPRVRGLVLVARRRERLDELGAELRRVAPSLRVLVQGCDLADEGATEAMLEQVQAELGAVDILINNAGLGDYALFDRASWDKTERMLKVNVLGLCRLTHRLLGPMVEQGSGGVLMVSSGLGLAFLPGYAAYAGSKHFVTAFTEALRLELCGSGVTVSQICPGPVATEFEELAGSFAGRRLPRLVQMSPERCAAIALRGFERGRALVVPGIGMRLVLWLAALAPRAILRLVLAPVGRWLRRRARRDGAP
ncbi:MAG: SDR family oxidoreductase [Deltaproteobacteria bacterium]|nr:SDR family oxidoreductase [Deltaproteobacteria bacterium]